ncbi:MAG: OmpH family outer membrane protein [Proteobacteria bacterium]|nr:OmpH family outer membrane protein [Pseudomonadota bacterium]
MRRLVLLLALFWALPLFAAEPPAPHATNALLVVDVKRILDESKASVSVQKKIEAQRAAFQTEIAAKEKLIRDAEQELLATRGKLEARVYAERENQLRQKFREVEQYVQDRRRLLEQATTLSMGKVRSVLLGIVTEIARRRGAQAVLIKQQVLWAENALDITDQVLERLNAQLPDLPVEIETPKEPAKEGKKP